MGAQGVHAFGKQLHVVYDLKYSFRERIRISGSDDRDVKSRLLEKCHFRRNSMFPGPARNAKCGQCAMKWGVA